MICRREDCNNVVPPGRRKYCCAECGKIAHRRKAAMELSLSRARSQSDHLDVKVRICLRCNTRFRSDGPWNRLCPKCKRRELVRK